MAGRIAGLRGGDDCTATEQRRRRSCRDGRRVIVCVRIVWFFFRSRRQSAAVASPTMPDGRRRTMAASGDGCDGDLGSNRTPGDGCETRRAAAETDLGCSSVHSGPPTLLVDLQPSPTSFFFCDCCAANQEIKMISSPISILIARENLALIPVVRDRKNTRTI